MKTLLFYATREGQTEKIALRIAGQLEQAGVQVTVLNAGDTAAATLDPDGFDLLVFGASMHVGKLEPEVLRFIDEHRNVISTKPRSFFLVLLAAATKDPEERARALADADRRVAAQLAVAFDDIERIAGAIAYTKYGFLQKWIMRRIARSQGGGTDTSRDYEYTDWDQVAAYARRLPTLVG